MFTMRHLRVFQVDWKLGSLIENCAKLLGRKTFSCSFTSFKLIFYFIPQLKWKKTRLNNKHSEKSNPALNITWRRKEFNMTVAVSPPPAAGQFIRRRPWMWKVSPFMRTATRNLKDDTSLLRLKRNGADIVSFENKGLQKLSLIFLLLLARDKKSFTIFANLFWFIHSAA